MLTWQAFLKVKQRRQRGARASTASKHRLDWLRRASRTHNVVFIGRPALRGEGPVMLRGVCRHPETQLARRICAGEFMTSVRCFVLFFVDFTDILKKNKPWRINNEGTRCDVWAWFSKSVSTHISLRPGPLLSTCCNVAIQVYFLCPDESSDYKVDQNIWSHCRLTVVCLGHRYSFSNCDNDRIVCVMSVGFHRRVTWIEIEHIFIVVG